MKKYIIFIIVIFLALAGCTSSENSNKPNEPIQGTEAVSELGVPDNLENDDSLEDNKSNLDNYELSDAPFDGSIVTIAKSDKELAEQITQDEIESMVNQVLNYTDEFDNLIKNGQTVVIKPNLVQMKVDSTGDLLDKEVNGITTDWRVTNAVVKRVRVLNPDGKVYIMEGSASGPTSEVMKYYHYTPEYIKGVDAFISLEEDCGNWQDFDAPEVTKVVYEDGLLHKEYYFNKILYEADVLISIPCLKTSSGVVVTAGIKNVSLGTPPGNLYGEAPDNPSKAKMVSHKIVDGELDKWIYDYFMCKPVNYVIVDGLQGFQSGPVPMSQERKETDKMNMGVILGGKDAVSVDTVCALITGWDPKSVGYLKLLEDAEAGIGELKKISVRGGFVDDLRKYFTIKRPELGGIQITDQDGPESTTKFLLENDVLNIFFSTNEKAIKWETYINGYFADSSPVYELSDVIQVDINNLPPGKYKVDVIFYDRFLNKTIKNFILTI